MGHDSNGDICCSYVWVDTRFRSLFGPRCHMNMFVSKVVFSQGVPYYLACMLQFQFAIMYLNLLILLLSQWGSYSLFSEYNMGDFTNIHLMHFTLSYQQKGKVGMRERKCSRCFCPPLKLQSLNI